MKTKNMAILIITISILVIGALALGIIFVLPKYYKNTPINPNSDNKTFTITFDSNGGSSVSKLVWPCNKELELPSNPTKSGYTFVAWKDKNEVPILNGALLTCDDITLYASWEKQRY